MSATRTIVIPSLSNCIGKLPSVVAPRNVICTKPEDAMLFTNSSPLTCISTFEKIPRIPTTNINVEEKRQPSRKRRLDHLTLEEKLQRKKLKNRVAAQTSRDRKKAKMDELETIVKDLREKTNQLSAQCERLLRENQRLSEQNEELRRQQCGCQALGVSCRPAVAGPAVSTSPLPQGQSLQLAQGLGHLMTTLFLLFSLISQMTTLPSWKSWQTVCWEKEIVQWMERRRMSARQGNRGKTIVLLKWWGRHQKTWKPLEDY
ncbi:X-box-binding protein 1 [Schistocerca americana]|uniref:X-box-binding protein 1 n=1 Tax=Schistocerca americana TaxID=7009 RepID=UPI001F4F6FFF|nr:X-box-binding protein 1 [Schistocerca americana]XP_047113758.1 X-box-binding protein 1 [Schistocerca piceifrons]XP_049964853.1 X-box-binding protein 1 [Schistocerca serialis cubense]